jgi:hypothetical protein
MALSTSLPETNIGIPLADTYARIVLLRCDNGQCLIQVAHYANADARRANAQPVYDRTFFAPADELQPGADPIAIGYAWLKTQPEYADAVDC